MSYQRLTVQAAEFAGREAVRADGVSISYSELFEMVEAAARGLVAQGIEAQSTVGLSIADEVQNFIAMLALVRLGARQISLPTHDTVLARAQVAEQARVGVVLAAEGSVPVADLPMVRWPPEPSRQPVAERQDGSFLFRTSGTTGRSNLVPMSLRDLEAQAGHTPEYAGQRLYRPASVEHNNGKRHRLYCFISGGTNVFRSASDDDLVALCRRHQVTRIDLALLHLTGLIAGGSRLDGVDVYAGGSTIPLAVRQAFEQRVSGRLHVRYAATEAGAIAICRPGEHAVGDPVGRPVTGIELQIVDEDGNLLPAGEAGHIRLRGGGVALGYFEDAEQTARRFRDGWFWPGDMGAVGTDGILQFRGRADEMIVLNGINIFPTELEQVLLEHPAVTAAAAGGLPSSAHGDIPVAAVEIRAGAAVDERALLAFARERLSLRAPRRIAIVDALPRSDMGKILRRELPRLFGR